MVTRCDTRPQGPTRKHRATVCLWGRFPLSRLSRTTYLATRKSRKVIWVHTSAVAAGSRSSACRVGIRADQQARATWTRDDQPGEARRRHEKMAPRTAGTRLLRHQRGASSGSSDRQGARTSSLGLHTRSTTDGRRRGFRRGERRSRAM